MSQLHSNSSFTACFFPTTTTKNSDHHPSDPPPPPPPPAPISGKPNLSTCLYNTHLGLFSLTWSMTLFGHSLHLDHHPFDYGNSSPISFCSNSSFSHAAFSFHLHIKPLIFWKKRGSKKLSVIPTNKASKNIQLFWDLSKARFGSGPEPQSGFYIAVVVDGEMSLLVGDCIKEAYAKTKAQKPERSQAPQALVLRREHVFGNKVYTTKAKFGGKTRDVSIDCSTSNDARLCFSVDNVRVLQIKRLKWKFRGNERIDVDGVPVQISWDVYNWLFDDCKSNKNDGNGHAVFMFRFEDTVDNEEEQEPMWQLQQSSCSSFGMSGIEWRKMRKSLMRTARSSSSSSISMSSSSSGCSSSVMEWASMEESELSPGPNGFSLLVYIWKK